MPGPVTRSAIAQAAACWLIALILFAFSAPLSMGDFGRLPGNAGRPSAPASRRPHGASLAEAVLARALSTVTERVRARRHAASDGPSTTRARTLIPSSVAILLNVNGPRVPRPLTKAILRI